MANKNLGLRYVLLNSGIDNLSATDICQKIIFSNLESQFMIYGAAESVVKKSNNGQERNCDSAILYLLYVISRYIPLSSFTLSTFNVIENLTILGDYKSKYSTYRLALGKFFFTDEMTIICSQCASNGKINSSWQINNNGSLICGDCNSIDVFVNCRECSFSLFKVEAKGQIKCTSCKENLFSEPQKKRSDEEDSIIMILKMMSLVYKADGRITQDEVDQIIKFLKDAGITKKQRDSYLKVMKDAKTVKFSKLIDEFYQLFNGNLPVLTRALSAMLFAASADRIFHPGEDDLILQAVRKFKIDMPVYEQMKKEAFEKNEVIDINWCYKILECNHNFKDIEIRRKYRDLQQKYHPDKASKFDLPDHIQEMILEKSKEINRAYVGLKTFRDGI